MATRLTRRRDRFRSLRAFAHVDDELPIDVGGRRQGERAAKRRRRLRDPHSPLFPLQPFRFGGLFGAETPFTAKGEAAAATCGLVAFGLRASLLPRRWDLAIVFSFGGVRRRNR